MTLITKENCIFLFETLLGEKFCVLDHKWQCETDATLCGTTCPDYRGKDDEH